MLVDIKAYLIERERASLQELAFHFRQKPDVMRDMMSYWVCKGKVCCIKDPPGCGSTCFKCQPELAEEYCWVK